MNKELIQAYEKGLNLTDLLVLQAMEAGAKTKQGISDTFIEWKVSMMQPNIYLCLQRLIKLGELKATKNGRRVEYETI